MTGGVIYGGGRRTWLAIVGVCSSGAPLIYIGWRGGEAAKGAPQVGGILLGVLPIRPPPFLLLFRVGREEGGGGILFPFSFPSSPFLLQFGQPIWEGHQPLSGWCVSPLGPLGPYSLLGVSRNPFR